MNIRELEEASGHPARLIRFLIAEGIIPPPSGGKKFASYGNEHLEGLRIYSAAKAEGVASLEIVRKRIEDGVQDHVYEIAPGVKLTVSGPVMKDIEGFVERTRKLAEQFKEERK